MQYLQMLYWCSATYNLCIKAVHIPRHCNALAYHTSCLYMGALCQCTPHILLYLTFYHVCISPCKIFSFWSICPTFCFFFIDAMIHGLLQDILHFRKTACAPTSRKSFKTFCNTYIHFCGLTGICNIPSFLLSLSVGQYIHFVGLLHKDMNLPKPVSNICCLWTVIYGIKGAEAN